MRFASRESGALVSRIILEWNALIVVWNDLLVAELTEAVFALKAGSASGAKFLPDCHMGTIQKSVASPFTSQSP